MSPGNPLARTVADVPGRPIRGLTTRLGGACCGAKLVKNGELCGLVTRTKIVTSASHPNRGRFDRLTIIFGLPLEACTRYTSGTDR
jgi:hypothetical protein